MPNVLQRQASTDLIGTWQRVVERIAERVSPEDVTRFIRPVRPLGLTPTELRLEAPNKLTLLCVTQNFLEVIRDSVATVVGPRQVVVDLPLREQAELFPELTRGRRGSRNPGSPAASLNPKYTFANFVVGASNQFAHAACKAVATQPGDHYNPLFIYGGVGLGKTHLVSAIGHKILDRSASARIAYLSSEVFMNELITSLRKDRMGEFKDRFRQVDVLILDDVQLLAGRERTQEEFFHTFNTLYDNRRQIVLTSDKVPKDIPELEERLRNRFEWGLIADIQAPDVETRVAIVEKKAENEGIKLPPEVALFLASNFSSNVRELEGSLTRLAAYASLAHQTITVTLAEEVLHRVLKPRQSSVTFDEITKAVCEHFTLRSTDLRSKRRSRNVAVPRQVAMYLCRQLLNASFPHIGELFGRDHSTVMHAFRVTERRMKQDQAFRLAIEQMARALREQ